MDSKFILEYYDYTMPFYRILWHGNTHALHHGLWNKNTKHHKDALINTNRFLAEQISITKGFYVLDAGCGIGGTALWLAREYGVRVLGITLSEKQARKACLLAKKYQLTEFLTFVVKDYCNTGYPDETFDVVWALESVCHAADKEAFLRESHRILKIGGQVIISDGFLLRNPCNHEERDILKTFLDGLVLPHLAHIEDFEVSMNNIGFQNVAVWNMTQAVLPTVKRAYVLSLITYPIFKVSEWLRITRPLLLCSNRAGIAEKKGVDAGLMGYAVFRGQRVS